ncbi:hypothetical protein HMP09_2801 [Sphingomonas sp. HMP9]|nr:hypothetical protein HMP09_2801 [Sphingomonas sp. HMP9]
MISLKLEEGMLYRRRGEASSASFVAGAKARVLGLAEDERRHTSSVIPTNVRTQGYGRRRLRPSVLTFVRMTDRSSGERA